MAELIAVEGDENSHGAGGLIPSQSSVYVNDKLVIVDGDSASADNLCIPPSVHCAPSASDGSSSVFVDGVGVHLNNMSRVCGAITTVIGNFNVYVGKFTAVTEVTTLGVDPIPFSIALGESPSPPYVLIPDAL